MTASFKLFDIIQLETTVKQPCSYQQRKITTEAWPWIEIQNNKQGGALMIHRQIARERLACFPLWIQFTVASIFMPSEVPVLTIWQALPWQVNSIPLCYKALIKIHPCNLHTIAKETPWKLTAIPWFVSGIYEGSHPRQTTHHSALSCNKQNIQFNLHHPGIYMGSEMSMEDKLKLE